MTVVSQGRIEMVAIGQRSDIKSPTIGEDTIKIYSSVWSCHFEREMKVLALVFVICVGACQSLAVNGEKKQLYNYF